MNEQLTIHEAHGLLKAKKLSSVELTQDCLKRIKEVEPRVKALVSTTEELALKQAEKADKRLAKGDTRALHQRDKDYLLVKDAGEFRAAL